ncbi:DUF3127 domain-containing protein [Marinilongibacter aquaticus]|uniref:DUF3127 domain-containing protein n=1 Tax=Marinilongibacter aquaticus TaxID=2975157 RepID=UPI0021BD8489|nr:DUF3127 domain-containing protein [Marinilongibacter aquaticus]UBM60846.1 DUF3127 domain-containing protein [Marinilongibacter aquaticus]
MEISGNIIQVLPLQTGEGRNGAWKKQDFVIETEGQYPKKVCVSMWGDKIDASLIQVGQSVTASIDIESREYNGRWYTDVRAWKIDGQGGMNNAPDAGMGNAEIPASLEGEDDLPF